MRLSPSRDLVNEADGAPKFSFDVKLAALTAMTAVARRTSPPTAWTTPSTEDGDILAGGEELGYVSRFVVSAADSSVVVLTRDFKDRLEEAIDDNAAKFNYTDAEGNEAEYDIVYDAAAKVWSVKQMHRDLRLRPLRRPQQRALAGHRHATVWTC